MLPERKSSVPIRHGRAGLFARLAKSCAPRPLRTVSAWSEHHRVLTPKASSEPGRWRNDRAPHLAEIMDALSASSSVQEVVMMFGAQLGKTEAMLNWVGYVMDHAPGPMLVVVPTLEIRKKWHLQRLQPMLQASPALAALFRNRKRDAANSEEIKDFPGGMLVMAGANSPASLASMPIKYACCDEVDSYDAELGDEGDSMGLITQRQMTFPRRKLLLASTPKKDKGESIIEQRYLASDMREREVPCPHCGEYQVLLWRHPDGHFGFHVRAASGVVFYACRHCGEAIYEHHKTQMLPRGRWVARHPERKVRGYWLPSWYSAYGLGYTWAEIWAMWVEAQGDTGKLKGFVQRIMGETWESRKEGADALQLAARLEVYPETLPPTVRAVGIDVQKGRIEMTVWDIGAGEECWAVDHIIVEGDVSAPETWDDLEDEIKQIRPDCGAIDSGYSATEVYAFCERKTMRWMHITKGKDITDYTLTEDDHRRRLRLRARRKKGHAPHLIGNVAAMSLITQRLNLPVPAPGMPMPGYLHIAKGHPAFDDEWLRQLSSSAYVEQKRAKKTVYVWQEKATHPANEAFDCWKLAIAAVRLSKYDLSAIRKKPAEAVSTAIPSHDEGQTRPRRKANTAGAIKSTSDWSNRL